jgi:hypothetical protein
MARPRGYRRLGKRLPKPRLTNVSFRIRCCRGEIPEHLFDVLKNADHIHSPHDKPAEAFDYKSKSENIKLSSSNVAGRETPSEGPDYASGQSSGKGYVHNLSRLVVWSVADDVAVVSAILLCMTKWRGKDGLTCNRREPGEKILWVIVYSGRLSRWEEELKPV